MHLSRSRKPSSRVGLLGCALAATALSASVLAVAAATPAAAAPAFTPLGAPMFEGRWAPAAAVLPNGKVLVAGGENDKGVVLRTAEFFNFASGAFEPAPAPVVARKEAATVRLPDGRILLVGGWNDGEKSLKTAELFNPATNSFEAAAHEMAAERGGAAASLLPDGRVLIVGGTTDVGEYLSSAETYDSATGTFTALADKMAAKRGAPVAETLASGKALIAGGYSGNLAEPKFPRTAELFNPATNTFATIEGSVHELVEAREEAAHVRLADGRILLIGGSNSAELGTVEALDPESLLFARLPDELTTKRDYPAAVLLPDGRVFVVGGAVLGTKLNTAEIRGVSAPAVSTLPATAIRNTGATLPGTVLGETASTAYFQYGPSTSYGSTTGRQSVQAGLHPVGVDTDLGLLSPATVYHFRLVAENAGGTTYGTDQTLVTAGTVKPAPGTPRLSLVSQSHRRWRERTGHATRTGPRLPFGTTFKFKLDQAARVTLSFSRQASGRKVHDRCVAPTRRNRRARACKRALAPQSLGIAARPGQTRFLFDGHVTPRRRLAAGTYVVTISAVNAAGKRSAPARLTFTIVP
jgi:hypothetical protein